MLMLEQRIQQHFFDSADLRYQTAETLSRPIADAAQAVVGALTAGGKLLLCGTGGGAALAVHAAAVFVGRFERERPPLAALVLAAEPAFGQQVQALGQPGDVLLLVHGGGTGDQLAAAIDVAHAQEMTVLALAQAGAEWLGALAETDVAVALPNGRPARVLELQLLVLHALADAVDLQLLGEQENL
jgi:D-sedoheptulose 7-phosphate isomerase